MSDLEGGPVDARETRRRVEEALRKRDHGESLTEREWTIVQYALGGGCHACGGSGYRGMQIAVVGRRSGRGR